MCLCLFFLSALELTALTCLVSLSAHSTRSWLGLLCEHPSAPLSPRDYPVPSVGDQSPHCTFSPSLAGEAKLLDGGVGGFLFIILTL